MAGTVTTCDPNALAQLAACFKCVSPNTLREIQTYLLCQILLNGIGGSSGGGLLYGIGPPNGVVNGTTTATTTQAYLDLNTGIVSYHTGLGTSNTGWI